MNNPDRFRFGARGVMRIFVCLVVPLWFGVLVWADTHYVSLVGGNASPYTNGWANAAWQIQDYVYSTLKIYNRVLTKEEVKAKSKTGILNGSPAKESAKPEPIKESVKQPLIKPEKINSTGQRKRLADRTLLITRIERYPLFRNYLHKWADRPLLCDRGTLPVPLCGPEETRMETLASFSKRAKSARDYGVDSFSIFLHGELPKELVQYAGQTGLNDFYINYDLMFADNLATYKTFFSDLVNSKNALKVNGKHLLVSYWAGNRPIEKWEKILKDLRTQFGDNFIFVHDYAAFVHKALKEYQENNGVVSEETTNNAINELRKYLDVFDGLYFNAVSALVGNNDRKLDNKFYRDYFIPLYVQALNDKKYTGKYLGLSAAEGHHNTFIGNPGCSEQGTKSLRLSMESCLTANPDFIMVPEWDEFNENTCLCPTVCNSYANQRIMKYYMQGLKKEKPSPNPGDNISVPNSVLSYRRILTFGEPLEIEVLNVPDSDKKDSYTIQLSLKDIDGNIVKQFDEKKIVTDKLYDETFVMPTEELAKCSVIIPVLTLVNSRGEKFIYEKGLHHIQLRTWNGDYKWVKQPLRDIIVPKTAVFEALPGAISKDGGMKVKGTFECDEEIASAEVLEDDDEVFAYDINDEFKMKEDNIVLKFTFSCCIGGVDVKGKISLLNTDMFVFPQNYSGVYTYTGGSSINVATRVDAWMRMFVLTMPKKNIEKAVLDIDLDNFKMKVPVSKIVKDGIYSETRDNKITVTVEKYNRLFVLPLHINQKKVEFVTEVFPERENAPYHMRTITKSGKIYRSTPVILKKGKDTSTVKAPVYSKTKSEVVVCSLPSSAVPDISYDINANHGTMFLTAFGRPFYGQLGGRCDVSTGKGEGGEGYGAPLRGPNEYPANGKIESPEWVEEDGVQCLKFDGLGNFITFPWEFIPARGAYTLSFEIKPVSDKAQILFSHRGHGWGSITIKMVNGELTGDYYNGVNNQTLLQPKISVPLNKWSKITVVNNLNEIIFKVNDQEGIHIPYPGEGTGNAPSVFGGFGKGTEWFEGYLKSIRIRHTVDE